MSAFLAGARWQQRARLVSGLVLFVFVLTHFINHALGLISISAMEWMNDWRGGFWRTIVGTALLYSAFVVHIGLAVHKLILRRTLRMPAWEMVQLGLGLIIPPLLVGHVLETRMAHEAFDYDITFASELYLMWPDKVSASVLAIFIVWVHAAIGMHFWLRLKPWYPRWSTILFALAVLVPVLAAIGYLEAVRSVATLSQLPDWVLALKAETRWPTEAEWGRIWFWRDVGMYGFLGLFAAGFAVRPLRGLMEKARTVEVSYLGGPTVRAPRGMLILEISRMHGIPHASVCGGRGRCSTCRVRVLDGTDTGISQPNDGELEVLSRIKASPGVRLACQTEVRGPIIISTLLPAGADTGDVAGTAFSVPDHGVEKTVAVLFADIRGFTSISESRLPFDVVFLLNQYCRAVGGAIVDENGFIDKFIGDGVMALFGIGEASTPGEACRDALCAARSMLASIDGLNRSLSSALEQPLRIGIGIHVGQVIVGKIGFRQTRQLTAVGDTVNIAARLEEMTKSLSAPLVVSKEVLEAAGLESVPHAAESQIDVRGRTQKLNVVAICAVEALPGRDSKAVDAVPVRPAS